MAASLRQQAMHKRARAREMLVAAGHRKSAVRPLDGLLYAIEVEMGEDRRCEPDAWVDMYIKRFYRPAPSRAPREFRALEISPISQWALNTERARRAQPPLWTPAGVGNGGEGVHGFGRGC